jgi:hypothetical protein
MIIAVFVLAFLAIWAAFYCAISLGLGLNNSRDRSRIVRGYQDRRLKEDVKVHSSVVMVQTPQVDEVVESVFTDSLLAMGKVRTLDPYEPPVIAPAGSHRRQKSGVPKRKTAKARRR